MAAIDVKSAEALVSDAARTFSEGLKGLTARAVAEVDVERQRLVDEAHKLSEGKASLEAERRRLEELRGRLDEEYRHLERGFSRLAQERAEFESGKATKSTGTPSFGAAQSPSVLSRRETLDARDGGVSPSGLESWATAPCFRGFQKDIQSNVASCSSSSEGVLSRCTDEVLAAAFSSRSPALADFPETYQGLSSATVCGRILVDFRPALLTPALEKFMDSEDVPVVANGAELERRFLDLLAQHGAQGWVYHETCEELVDSLVIRGRRYAVLPSAGPEEASVLLDMYDSIVSVPPGWEVLSTAQDGFQDIIQELAKNGWGTSLLCVKNAEGGFSSYRTALYTHGAAAGTRVSADSSVLQVVDNQGTQYKFSKGMVLSGRLVICASRAGHGRNRF
mmetsp:Transcript_40546/g.71314  ORF Transcript_40546/g.71314 Transcript_40546/m.71314 type:complete len:394 (-) Transcript_40546:117-1298(-)